MDIGEIPYDLQAKEIADEIIAKGYKRVILQFPEGLKIYSGAISNEIKGRTDAEVLVYGEPTFGACDLPLGIDADLLVHFGHSEMPDIRYEYPVMYVPLFSTVDPLPAVEDALDMLPEKVGLASTIQHVKELEKVKKFLAGKGIEAHIGKGDGRIAYPGQVLGCNVSSARAIADDVDIFLFIGTGNFHPIAIEMGTGKKVVIADPGSGKVRDLKGVKDRILRQRFAAIERSKDAQSFGIIVSTKQGQTRMDAARRIKETIDSKGKNCSILVFNELSPEKLMGHTYDAFVSTACPRLAIDDAGRYDKPILTPPELDIALSISEWEQYRFDEIEAPDLP